MKFFNRFIRSFLVVVLLNVVCISQSDLQQRLETLPGIKSVKPIVSDILYTESYEIYI